MPYNHAMARGRGARHEMPDVDERLVMPESGIEILDGKVLSVPGANPPHARHHAQLAYLLQAHAAPVLQVDGRNDQHVMTAGGKSGTPAHEV